MRSTMAVSLICFAVLIACTKKKEAVEVEAPADATHQAVVMKKQETKTIKMAQSMPEPDSEGAIILKQKVSPVLIMKQTEISNSLKDFAFTKENTNKGKAIYLQHCSRCHGMEGHGDGPDESKLSVTPTNFHEFPIRYGKDIKDIVYSIRYGRNEEEMPAFRSILSKEEMWTVAYYVEAWIALNKSE